MTPALAGPGSQLGTISPAPTIHAAGVTVQLVGDDDGDAKVAVAYRPSGGAWQAGHPLLPRQGSKLHVGSLFYLQPATAYELRVTLEDPDNSTPAEQIVSFTTRADAPTPPSGETIHVSASQGDDNNNDGSAGKPLATINAALAKAQAGDEVRVAAGVYREAVVVPKSGTEAKPLWIRGEPGAVLDGSDPDLAGASWTLYKDDVYYASWSKTTNYLAVDDTRIYDYASLAELEAKSGGQSGQSNVLEGGFFVDTAQKRLYLRLPQGGSPAGKQVHAGILAVAMLIDGRSHIVVEGLEIRYYGGQYAVGVDLRGATRCWLRKLHVHHLLSGIRSRKGGGENVIEQSRVRDTSIYDWPWASVKAHTGEASAISLAGGAGDIVRHNTLEGLFNGIYTGEFNSSPDLALAANIDVYENLIRQAGDDGLEPEGACVNQRFWHNVIVGVHNGISLAPIDVGPVWFVRNVIANYRAHALKLNNGSTGPMLVYHTTSIPGAGVDQQPLAPSIPFGGLVSRNNIWAGHRYVIEYGETSLAGTVDLDYDDLHTDNADGGSRFAKWLNVRYDDLAAFRSGTGLEAHGFSVAPAYQDAAQGDYSLVAGHALLDVGVALPGINHLGLSGAPDVGAFERGGLRPRPGADAPPLPPGLDGSPALDGGRDGSSRRDSAGGGDGSAPPAGDGSSGDGGATPNPSGCGCGAVPGSEGLPPALLLLLAIGGWMRRQRPTISSAVRRRAID